MRHISIFLYPQALSSSIGLPAEMFQAANEISRVRNRRRSVPKIEIVGLGNDMVQLAGGTRMLADKVWGDIADTDLIILPALWRNPLKLASTQDALLAWFKRQWENGCQLCAVGSASFLLAEAGLLDGRPATTHWHYLSQFAHAYPQAQLQRSHLITKAGRIFCVGSVNALADLVVQLIAESFGRSIAQSVESHFSPEIRQPCNTRMFDFEANSPHADEDILNAQHWLRSHYDQSISIPALAARLSMTVRTFNRRFKKACGYAPSTYLQNVRMENAKELLRSSNYSVAEIAHQVGHPDPAHFSAKFKQWVGIPPRLYRLQVRQKLFSDNWDAQL